MIFFVPSAGVRWQAVEDDGITRTVGNATDQGNGTRHLSIAVSGDVEGLPEALEVFGELERLGLVVDLHLRPTSPPA